jgi:hypothetical protein
MFGLFNRIQPTRLADQQLHEARVHLLEFEAAKEHAEGMVNMLKKRVARLEGAANDKAKVQAKK